MNKKVIFISNFKNIHYPGIYFLLLIFIFIWCLLFSSVPILYHGTSLMKKTGGWLFLFFSQTCHQIPERSLAYLGYHMAVCGRCAGIYYGSLLGSVIYPVIRKALFQLEAKSRPVLLVAAIPIIVDVVLSKTGLIESSNLIRLITGLFSGLFGSIIILNLLFKIPNKEVS